MEILEVICESLSLKEKYLGILMECEWVKESLHLIEQVQDSTI